MCYTAISSYSRWMLVALLPLVLAGFFSSALSMADEEQVTVTLSDEVTGSDAGSNLEPDAAFDEALLSMPFVLPLFFFLSSAGIAADTRLKAWRALPDLPPPKSV